MKYAVKGWSNRAAENKRVSRQQIVWFKEELGGDQEIINNRKKGVDKIKKEH